MSASKPITIRCSARIARCLGARHLPPAPSAISIAVVLLVDTEIGLMFWPVQEGAASLNIGNPANRRPGAII